MRLYSEDIELMKELYYKKKIDIYFFHEKYKLSPAQLARSINKFVDKGLVDFNNNQVVLNKDGVDWIFRNRKILFLEEKSKYWKEIPEEMKQTPIAINSPYKPNLKYLDKEIFKDIEDGK